MSTPDFAAPAQPFRTTVPASMAVMAAVALHPGVARRWDDALGSKVPSAAVKTLWWTTIGLHVAESVGVARRARAHDMPVGRWVAQTMVYGVFSMRAQRAVERRLADAAA